MSYTKLFYHIVFVVKNRLKVIDISSLFAVSATAPAVKYGLPSAMASSPRQGVGQGDIISEQLLLYN